MATTETTEKQGPYAVIATGGKQYVVSEGDVISTEIMEGVKEGDTINFDEVLLVDDGTTTKLGAPTVSGSKVSGEVMEEGRAKKISVIHYRSKSRHFKKNGHRQPFIKVKITSVK